VVRLLLALASSQGLVLLLLVQQPTLALREMQGMVVALALRTLTVAKAHLSVAVATAFFT